MVKKVPFWTKYKQKKLFKALRAYMWVKEPI